VVVVVVVVVALYYVLWPFKDSQVRCA
jgi:hypothetical protein